MGMLLNPYKTIGVVASPVILPVSPLAFYSTTRLSTWNGNCCRIVRASDNSELDIGFVGNIIDMDAANTFAGGSAITVKTWYDQSGNGYNLTQATIANQPSLSSDAKPVTGGKQPICINGNRETGALVRKLLSNASLPITQNNFDVLMCVAPSISFQENTYALHPTGVLTTAIVTVFGNVGMRMYNNGTLRQSTTAPRLMPPVQPCVIGYRGDATNSAMSLDANSQTYATPGTSTITGVDVGAYTPTPVNSSLDGRFNIYSLAVFGSSLSAPNRTSSISALGETGGVTSGQANKLVWMGDSRTEGIGCTLLRNIPHRLYNKLSIKPYQVSFALSGQQMSSDDTNFASRYPFVYDAGRARNILIINGYGINDFGTGSRTALQVQGYFTSICGKARAAGYLIHCSTVLPASVITGSKETERVAYNNWMRANWATYADAFTDIDANPNLATVNATYYTPDGTHNTDAGQELWTTLIEPAIAGLMV